MRLLSQSALFTAYFEFYYYFKPLLIIDKIFFLLFGTRNKQAENITDKPGHNLIAATVPVKPGLSASLLLVVKYSTVGGRPTH